MNYGYNGKILHVNLNDGSTVVEQPDAAFYRRYVGNGIMAAYYLLQKTKPNIDPLSPANLLMFMSGAVNGHEAPGLARFAVCGKSPLTGGIGEARSEGPFAISLKKSGYDGIIIEGAREKPSIIVIDDGTVKIVDAEDLWGLSVGEVTDRLETEYPGASVAAIGRAGENLVRFANVISHRCHAASRSGMGAVMGSKNLKALVIQNGELPKVYDPKKLKDTYKWFENRMHDNVLSMWQHDVPGFGVWIHTHGIDASLSVNNYQTATCTYTDKYTPEHFLPYYKGESRCPGCPNNCIKLYAADETDAQSGGLHQEIAGSMGPNIGTTDVGTIIKANVLCNELGLDTNSLGYTISFAQECVQRGLLDPGDLDLSFSDAADILKLVEMIGNREGLGDLLAEGSARAARKIGGGAEQYALTVKGNEVPAFELRSQTNLAVGYATSPTGPSYVICEHDWDYDPDVGWPHTLENSRTLGILERIPMEYVGRDKVSNYKGLNNLWSAAAALGICIFSAAPTRVYSLEDMAALIHTVTGWKTSSYEVMRIGEMRNHIFRVYNNREGFTLDDDTLPKRFFEEAIDHGPHEGTKLDEAKFKDAILFYYDMMGWDELGKPKASTLYDYGLDWLYSTADG